MEMGGLPNGNLSQFANWKKKHHVNVNQWVNHQTQAMRKIHGMLNYQKV